MKISTQALGALLAAVLLLIASDRAFAEGPIRRLLRERRERGQRLSDQEHKPGDSQGALVVEGRERSYLLHLPAGFVSAPGVGNRHYPLILVFHGGHGSGEKVAGQTKFSDYADREQFIVVYPDGIEHSWNDGRGTTKAAQLGVDDVRFVRLLIEELKRDRKSTRLNSSHLKLSRMPSSA